MQHQPNHLQEYNHLQYLLKHYQLQQEVSVTVAKRLDQQRIYVVIVIYQ